jgi:hypothetical protein
MFRMKLEARAGRGLGTFLQSHDRGSATCGNPLSNANYFRRIWVPKTGRYGRHSPCPASARPRSILEALPKPSKHARGYGFDRTELGGHSLSRGALTTGMHLGVHPTKLKRFGRHDNMPC